MKTTKIALLMLVMVSGCANPQNPSGALPDDASRNDVIAKAQEIYAGEIVVGETDPGLYIQAGTDEALRSTPLYDGYQLLSGVDNPLFESAEVSGGIVTAELVSLTDVSYAAVPYDELGRWNFSCGVDISRRLIVDTDKATCVISYTIPDYGSGVGEGFSGAILYQNKFDNLVKAERYENGKVARSAERDSPQFESEVRDIMKNTAVFYTGRRVEDNVRQ